MDDHRDIIRSKGGIRALARALNHKNHTTVQGWWERGRIPAARFDEVARIASPEPAGAE